MKEFFGHCSYHNDRKIFLLFCMLFVIGLSPKFAKLSKISWKISKFWERISVDQIHSGVEGKQHQNRRHPVRSCQALSNFSYRSFVKSRFFMKTFWHFFWSNKQRAQHIKIKTLSRACITKYHPPKMMHAHTRTHTQTHTRTCTWLFSQNVIQLQPHGSKTPIVLYQEMWLQRWLHVSNLLSAATSQRFNWSGPRPGTWNFL